MKRSTYLADDMAPKERRKLLAEILEGDADGPNFFKLSFQQEGLWLEQKARSGESNYNVPLIFEWGGPALPSALHVALNRIIARHEIFRVSFVSVQGIPYQRVADTLEIPLWVHDLTGYIPQGAVREFENWRTQEWNRHFDLEKEPLIRAHLFAFASKHILMITMPHIITDGWSANLLRSELNEIYQAYATGRLPELPKLEFQYSGYVREQRALVNDTDGALTHFWSNYLEGLTTEPLFSPQSCAKSTDKSNEASGRLQSFTLDAKLANRIRALCRDLEITPFIYYLSIYYIALLRIANYADMTIGIPVANRTDVRHENLMGLLVNTIPLRLSPAEKRPPSFEEVLQLVRSSMLSAFAHQEMPLKKIAEIINLNRGRGHPSLFQTLFAFQNFAASDEAERKSQSEHSTYDRVDEAHLQHEGDAKLDLLISLDVSSGNTVQAYIEYRTAVFSEDEATSFIRNFTEIVETFSDPSEHKQLIQLPSRIEHESAYEGLEETEAHGDTVSEENTDAIIQSSEEVVTEVFKNLLKVSSLHADDDFFELGGHSLLAMRAIGQIEEQLGVELTLITFFECPSSKALAKYIDRELSEATQAAPAI